MFPPNIPALEIYAGDDFEETIRFREFGQTIDLSDWADWESKWVGHGHQEMFTIDATEASQGLITLKLTAEQTRQMSGRGIWDLQAKKNSLTRTWVSGGTTWRDDVTGRV